MTQTRLAYKLLLLTTTCLMALLFCGCSSDDGGDGTDNGADGTGELSMNVGFEWEVLEGQFVKFFYQPVDSIRAKAPALLKTTEQMYANITFALQNQDIDTLHFYCFADLRDLLNATGLNFTTVIGDTIVYGYGPVYGKHVTQYVMSEIGPTQFAFMQEGLPLVFDYSGRNFHDLMNERIESGDFSKVSELVDNATFETLDAGSRGIEAASLCAFMLTQWGPTNFRQKSEFRQLYESTDDFATAANIYFGASVDEIQTRWLEFVPTQTDEALSQQQDLEAGP